MAKGNTLLLRLRQNSHRALRFAVNPLSVSNIATSLTGAGSLFGAALLMPSGQFGSYAILNLISVTVWGFARVSLFQPALMRYRTDKLAVVPARFYWTLCLVIVAPTAAAYALFAGSDPSWAAALALLSLVPVAQDWMRHRALAEGRRWAIAIGDLVRLVATVTVFAVPVLYQDAEVFQAVFSTLFIIPLMLLLVRRSRVQEWAPYGSYRPAARSQVADFSLSQLSATIPLLIIGASGSIEAVAGVRLAQGLLGPLNLALSAASQILLADSVSQPALAADRAFVAEAKVLAWRMAALSVAVVAAGLVAALLLPTGALGVAHGDLVVGLVSVGILAITSGWSAIHVLALRILNLNKNLVFCRALYILGTLLGYVLGNAIGGTLLSILMGYAVASVLYPALFGSLAYRAYRRRLGQELNV